jgi:hypothetical protein
MLKNAQESQRLRRHDSQCLTQHYQNFAGVTKTEHATFQPAVAPAVASVIQMTRAICGKMGLENIMADKEIRELSQNTSMNCSVRLWRNVFRIHDSSWCDTFA